MLQSSTDNSAPLWSTRKCSCGAEATNMVAKYKILLIVYISRTRESTDPFHICRITIQYQFQEIKRKRLKQKKRKRLYICIFLYYYFKAIPGEDAPKCFTT